MIIALALARTFYLFTVLMLSWQMEAGPLSH